MKELSSARSEAGSASVLVLGAILACGLVSALWLSGADAAIARQRTETAADLAALAAARTAAAGSGTPCGVAEQVAVHNGAQLASCRVSGASGTIVTVTVRATSTRLGRVAQATARAGPQER